MYGREKIAVVKATNAVSATRNTFSGSRKNSPCQASTGPSAMTRAVSAPAPSSVAKLKATFRSRAKPRWPMPARSAAPASGEASKRRRASMRSVVLQALQVADVQAVELLADLEQEHAEDQDADQHVERDAELHDHRHAVGRRDRREEEPVLHGEEADDLRHRLR